MWRFTALFVACLMSGAVQAQPETLSSAQIEQIRRVTGYQLSQAPENRGLRFRYAQASYQSGRHAAAKYHLQQLMRSSPSARDLKQLQQAYSVVAEDAPWSFNLNFSVLPSTNINKTSSNEIFETPLGSLLIVDGGEEKTGVGLRYGAQVSYESPLYSGASLIYGLEVNRSQYPSDRLNSVDGTARLTWKNYSLSGVTQLTPYLGWRAYDVVEGDSSDSIRYGLRIGYEHFLTDDSSIAGAFTTEYRDYDEKDYLDGTFYSASLSYHNQITDIYHLRLQAGLNSNLPEMDHLRYIGAFMSGEVTRPVKSWGAVGLSVGFTKREYEGSFPALGEPRGDHSASLGMSFRLQKIRMLGSAPKFSCRIQQNWSNVALYEYQSTDCAISFERSF